MLCEPKALSASCTSCENACCAPERFPDCNAWPSDWKSCASWLSALSVDDVLLVEDVLPVAEVLDEAEELDAVELVLDEADELLVEVAFSNAWSNCESALLAELLW